MMTPDDVAAIRTAHSLKCCCDRCALCDALEAAWAERDEWHDSHTHWRTEFKAMRERAERAEAAALGLDAQLRDTESRMDRYVNAETGWTPEDMAHAVESVKHWRERAERAEKRCDELRPWAASWVREGQVAVAALARVQAMCEDPNTLSPTSLYWDHIHPDDLRAAIEGDNQ